MNALTMLSLQVLYSPALQQQPWSAALRCTPSQQPCTTALLCSPALFCPPCSTALLNSLAPQPCSAALHSPPCSTALLNSLAPQPWSAALPYSARPALQPFSTALLHSPGLQPYTAHPAAATHVVRMSHETSAADRSVVPLRGTPAGACALGCPNSLATSPSPCDCMN